MSRIRQRSEKAQQAIASLRASQQMGQAAIIAASDSAVVTESVQTLQGNIDAIDASGINATLAALDARVEALETP